MAGRNLSGHRATGGGDRGDHPLVRRNRSRCGRAPRGRLCPQRPGGHAGGPGPACAREPDLDDHEHRRGPFHDLHRHHDRLALHYLLGAVVAWYRRKAHRHRGLAAGARSPSRGGVDGRAGAPVPVLLAPLCAGIECGRISEPRPQTAGERGRVAGEQAGLALADSSGYAALAAFAGACAELLLASLYPICRIPLRCENLVCHGNTVYRAELVVPFGPFTNLTLHIVPFPSSPAAGESKSWVYAITDKEPSEVEIARMYSSTVLSKDTNPYVGSWARPGTKIPIAPKLVTAPVEAFTLCINEPVWKSCRAVT